MSKVATPKETGHGGSYFEAKSIGFYLSCMLSKSLAYSNQLSTIGRIDFQIRADGWLFDDALLTLESIGAPVRIAISIKSNSEFNTKGCSKDLNRQFWEQYLCHNTDVFNVNVDFLSIVQRSLSAKLSAALNTLLSQAKNQDAIDLSNHLNTPKYSNALIRTLYKSFECPADLKELYEDKNTDTGNLLKRILFMEMDFENDNSQFEARSTDLCRTLLSNKDVTSAQDLFDHIVKIARQYIKTGGNLTIQSLLQIIRSKYDLAGIPNYQGDWIKLTEHTERKLSIINSKLGNKLTIDRKNSIQQIVKKLEAKPICVIHGISGAGKTALAKEFINSVSAKSTTIWLDAVDIDGSFESEIQLQHSIFELLKYVPKREAYIVIDGAEKFYHDKQKQKLILLLNEILSNADSWKLLITCPTENLDSLVHTFFHHTINTDLIDRFGMPSITGEVILNITESYPQIATFLVQKPVQNIFNNLTLLNKLLFNIHKISPLNEIGSIGETHIIDFVWNEEIENTAKGIQKSRLLKMISEKLADQLAIGVSTSDFSPADLSAADQLKTDKFIRIEQQKIVLTHDLYGEWARYKLLESYSVRLKDFLSAKHLSSPLWTKAIRLYGISLLEKDLTGEEWVKCFESFNGTKALQIIIQNSLLEAFIFSAKSYEILKNQKSLLFDNEGKNFKKLIKLFQISATNANPSILELAKKMTGFTESEASAYDRLPIIWHWPDMLQFLHENLDEVLNLDLISSVKICTTWLEKTPIDFVCRQEAADVTLKAAELIFKQQASGRYVQSEITEPVYKGLLAGYYQNPEKVSSLCLKICKREKSDEDIIEKKDKASTLNKVMPKSVSILDQLGYTKDQSRQWEGGPFERVDDTFQKLCLETNALLPLIYLNPSLGKEILLAVIIDEPQDRYLGASDSNERLSLHDPTGWFPAFYFRGPFLNFLKFASNEGIDLILQLTNFATDRWLENERAFGKTDQEITINHNAESKTIYGGFHVFGWAKNAGNRHHLLASALMALEKFLVDQIENGKPVESYIENILKKTHSAAVIGILITVGKFRPRLFLKELKDILPIYEFFRWDARMGQVDHSFFINDLPSSWREEAEKWRQNRARLLPLKDILVNEFLYNEEFEKELNPLTVKWQEDFEKLKNGDGFDAYLFQMIPQFKKKNYIWKTENGNSWYEFIEPVEISDALQDGREMSISILQENQVSFKMEKMIEDNLPFELEGAKYLWGKIQKWADVISDEDIYTDYSLGSPLTNAISSIELLLHHEDHWKDQHPEYIVWINKFFGDLINKRINKNERFDSHGTGFDWNVKFAKVAAKLWARDTKEKNNKRLLAACLVLFNEGTASAIILTASKCFKYHDPAFVQVQNLLIQYNNERRSFFIKRHEQPDELLPIQLKYINEFVDNHISTDQLEWTTNSDRRSLRLILNCLPDFNNIKDEGERTYVLFLLRQGLVIIDEKLKAIEDRDYPDEFDNSILVRVAECLPFLTEAENPSSYWAEVIKFGYLADKWVTVFCNSFFRIHLPEKERYPAMINILRTMVRFTHKWTMWEPGKNFNRHEDFRNCLVGLNPRILDVWNGDYREFIDQSKDIYQWWFTKNRYNPHTISGILKLMTCKSGEPVLTEGFQCAKDFFITSLDHREPVEGKVYVGHKDLDDKLASTLSVLWETKTGFIKSNASVFYDYRDLVQYLVAIENMVGIELQQRLVVAVN